MSEVDISDLITVQRAIEIIDGVAVNPRVVSVALNDAMGLRLAEEVVADRDYPAFDKALMDGFAIRAEDPSGALKVIGESAAGHAFEGRIGAGEAVAIM